MVTAYTLAFGGLLLLGGRIADYTGRKRTFIIGCSVSPARPRSADSPRTRSCCSRPAPCRAVSPP
jgi:MFS family permease